MGGKEKALVTAKQRFIGAQSRLLRQNREQNRQAPVQIRAIELTQPQIKPLGAGSAGLGLGKGIVDGSLLACRGAGPQAAAR